jgi:cell division protein FtsI/penicillin-binding protein 2
MTTSTHSDRSILSKLLGAGVFLSVIFIVIITVRLFNLHHDFQTQQENPQSEQNKPKTETQLLFEALMKNKQLIKIEADGRIRLPAKDYSLARKVAGQAIGEEEESLLDRLYYSIAGKAVQHQVAFWNHSRLFAAVRDNLPSSNKKTESRWSVRNQWDENPIASDWVPLSYGYVNGGRLRAGFNDWLSVADEMPLRYQATVVGRRTLRIQVIGRPNLSRLRGKKQLYACYGKNQAHKAGCFKVSLATNDASTYVIVLTLGSGTHKLDFTVTPVVNSVKKIDGIPIYLDENNQYAWEAVREYHRNPIVSDDLKYTFSLMTRDGQSLINNFDLTPSNFTRNNGLVPLVGYEKSDRYALTGILSRTSLPHDKTEVHLTLDSRLQQIAQKNLQIEMPLMGSNAEFARKRRAAVVLMNPHTGAILAAANYPNPPSGIHHWDRISYSRLYPNRDPFGVNAWQGLDNHNAPGSTFKQVTAMAAMQAVDEEGRDDLKKVIKGLSGRQYQRLTGLPISSFSYQPDLEITSKVSNAGNAPLSRSMPYRGKTKEGKMVSVYPRLRLGGGGECGKLVNSKNLGVREAVRDSLNVWFARLGVMMDGNKLETGGKDTSLAKMARLLGFGSIVPLASPSLPLSRILGGIGRGDVLNGFAGSLALDDRRIIKTELKNLAENRIRHSTALQRLTQNSFGQGVATTPMQMARVAATVATGKIPQPYLIEKWDNDVQKPVEPRVLKLSLIDYLRQGMKAVTEVGTAKHAFSRFYSKGRCRSYGKTGTAQLSGRGKNSRASYNSAWFVGWHEDKKGRPDVSFACMVTYAYTKAKRNGGTVCAPIVARILSDMEKKTAK